MQQKKANTENQSTQKSENPTKTAESTNSKSNSNAENHDVDNNIKSSSVWNKIKKIAIFIVIVILWNNGTIDKIMNIYLGESDISYLKTAKAYDEEGNIVGLENISEIWVYEVESYNDTSFRNLLSYYCEEGSNWYEKDGIVIFEGTSIYNMYDDTNMIIEIHLEMTIQENEIQFSNSYSTIRENYEEVKHKTDIKDLDKLLTIINIEIPMCKASYFYNYDKSREIGELGTVRDGRIAIRLGDSELITEGEKNYLGIEIYITNVSNNDVSISPSEDFVLVDKDNNLSYPIMIQDTLNSGILGSGYYVDSVLLFEVAADSSEYIVIYKYDPRSDVFGGQYSINIKK